jgi:hypothetical protein
MKPHAGTHDKLNHLTVTDFLRIALCKSGEYQHGKFIHRCKTRIRTEKCHEWLKAVAETGAESH